jgi:VWFA-related protein
MLWRAFTLGTVVVLAVAVITAQQKPPQFRSTADFVLLDVSVTDRSRRPVKGLTAEDFKVLEDGVPQTITTFNAVELPDAEVPPAKWMGRAVPDVQRNDMPADGRLIIILMDERQVSASPFAGKAAVDTAHAIVDQLSPKDVAAVAFIARSEGAQEFTTDRARLHAAVDTYAMGNYNPTYIVAVLRDLSRLLSGIPERRKLIIYIGAGHAFDPAVIGSLERSTTQDATGPDRALREEQLSAYHSMMNFFAVAERSNVNVYAIDPGGLDESGQLTTSKEFLRLISNASGGRAVTGNNMPASEIPRILGENASYYMIAFSSTNRRNDGMFRRVVVTVNRPNVTVRSRRGYVEGNAGALVVPTANPALNRLIPATDLAVSAWAAPGGSGASGSHPVALMFDVALPRLGAPPVEHVSLTYTIVDMKGQPRASGKQDLTVFPPRDGTGPTYSTGASAIANLPPGKYDIRIAAVSVERKRRGGLLADVVVPDFAKEGLSATGIFVGGVSASAPRVATVGDSLDRMLPVAPTLERAFAADAAAIAVLRFYQAKQPPAPVTVKATIVDARDKAVFEATEKLDAAAFAAGGADYQLALPLAKLAAGRFLLRIDASRSGAPAVRRDLVFRVR